MTYDRKASLLCHVTGRCLSCTSQVGGVSQTRDPARRTKGLLKINTGIRQFLYSPSSKTHQTYSLNPPYSLNVETNVGKIFLELLDLHFPPGHVLRSVMNRNCVKISYRCLPNMGSHISRHNSKILREEDKNQEKPPPKCNCQISKKDQCPIPGACNQKGVIYQAKVTSQGGKNTQTYVGLAKDFKARYSKHKTSLENPSPDNSTTLSTYFLKEEAAGNNPILSWKFLKTKIPAFNPVTGTCRLCLSEKFHILFKPECATLNSILRYLKHVETRSPSYYPLTKNPKGVEVKKHHH